MGRSEIVAGHDGRRRRVLAAALIEEQRRGRSKDPPFLLRLRCTDFLIPLEIPVQNAAAGIYEMASKHQDPLPAHQSRNLSGTILFTAAWLARPVSVERPPSLIHDDRHKPVPDRETDGPTGRQRSGPSKTSKLQVSLCQSLDWLELVLPCMTYFSYGSAPQFSGIERHSVTSLPVGGRILSRGGSKGFSDD